MTMTGGGCWPMYEGPELPSGTEGYPPAAGYGGGWF